MKNGSKRRPLVAIIGDGGAPAESLVYEAARAAGRAAVDRGFRVVSGGLGGIMEAAFMGARESAAYREGDTLAIVPQVDPSLANEYADVVLATGLGHVRNSLVANSDAVVAIGGGAGTLCEMSFAWMFGRLIVAVPISGWSRKLADQRLDDKIRHPDIPDDRIYSAPSAAEALDLVVRLLPRYRR